MVFKQNQITQLKTHGNDKAYPKERRTRQVDHIDIPYEINRIVGHDLLWRRDIAFHKKKEFSQNRLTSRMSSNPQDFMISN